MQASAVRESQNMSTNSSFTEYCNELREYVRVRQRNRQDALLSLAAIRAGQKADLAGSITNEALTKILSAAISTHLGPFYVGTDLLARLFSRFPEVRAAWKGLACSPVSHERWVAVTALADHRVPKTFAERIVRRALHDKSPKVRFWAVERVFTRELRSLIPELRALAVRERNNKVASHIRWVLANQNMDLLDR